MQVQLVVKHSVDFGDTIKVVGDASATGEWDTEEALAMEWEEGDVWTASAELPPEQHEFKVDGSFSWLSKLGHQRGICSSHSSPPVFERIQRPGCVIVIQRSRHPLA